MKTSISKIFSGLLVMWLMLTVVVPGNFLLNIPIAKAASITVEVADDDIDAGGGVNCTNIVEADLANGDGDTTFREAVCVANNVAGADTIDFVGNLTISLTSALPAISDDETTITTGGATINVDGNGQTGLQVSADNCAIKGLKMYNFSGDQVLLLSGNDNEVGATAFASPDRVHIYQNGGSATSGIMVAGSGNVIHNTRIGVDQVGAADGLTYGIQILGTGTVLGGTSSDDRNVISGNSSANVYVFSYDLYNPYNITIAGNYIGLNEAGDASLGTAAKGIQLAQAGENLSNITIGGTTAGSTNVISGHAQVGISFEFTAGTAINVEGNYIGTAADGSTAIGNGTSGSIKVESGSNVTIGGSTAARNIISGATGKDGVDVSGGSNIKIQSNYIGLDSTGTSKVGNGTGVEVNGGTDIFIGGKNAGLGNVISGNAYGITLTGGNDVYVRGNMIGPGPNGTEDNLGNTNVGIQIASNWGASDTARIGYPTEDGRNIISANGFYGIWANAFQSGIAIISGNYIGTDINGQSSLGDQAAGLYLDLESARGIWPTVTIGDSTSSSITNVISGNDAGGGGGGYGIYTDGPTSIYSSAIGVNAGGTGAVANNYGLALANGVDGTVNIGNDSLATGYNVISGNVLYGVSLGNPAATLDLTVSGNFIGTDVYGQSAIANAYGVYIPTGTAAGITIGDSSASSATNIISGNTHGGIISANAMNVYSSNIGTNLGGTGAIANAIGIQTTGGGTMNIGNASLTTGYNVISGNSNIGAYFGGNVTGVTFSGNYVGTDAGGYEAIPNGANGGVTFEAPGASNVVGTSASASLTNIISGNSGYGLWMFDDGSPITIYSSGIGINKDGTGAIANGSYGAYIAGSATFGAGSLSAGYNVISGNTGTGITFDGSAGRKLTVHGNLIGTNLNGDDAVANGGAGVQGLSCDSCTTTFGNSKVEGITNVISGNDGMGITLHDMEDASIYSSHIGVNKDGDAAVPNGSYGIYIKESEDTTIGSTTAAGQNVIAGNNGGYELYYDTGAGGAAVLGNVIGTDSAAGTVDLCSGNGVYAGTGLIFGYITQSTQKNEVAFCTKAIYSADAESENAWRNNNFHNNTTDIDIADDSNVDIAATTAITTSTTTTAAGTSQLAAGTIIDVYERTSSNGAMSFLGSPTVADGAWSLTGLSSALTSYYVVIATDASSNSSELSAEKAISPVGPTLSYATTVYDTSTTVISITSDSTNSGANVYSNGVDTGTDIEADGTAELTVNLERGATNTFSITIVDDAGDSSTGTTATITEVTSGGGGGGGGGGSSSPSPSTDSTDDTTSDTPDVDEEEATTPVDTDELAGEDEDDDEDFSTPIVVIDDDDEEDASVDTDDSTEDVVVGTPPVIVGELEDPSHGSADEADEVEVEIPEGDPVINPVVIGITLPWDPAVNPFTGFDPDTKFPPENIEDAVEDDDDDGMSDLWEEEYFGDNDADPDADTDGDGLTNEEEYRIGSDPLDEDSDNDGITDYEEAALGTDPDDWDSNDNGVSDLDEYAGVEPPTADPDVYDEDTDSDGDGLSDYYEASHGTDPNDADSDNDGLTDSEEVEYNTDPNTPDVIEDKDTAITNLGNYNTSDSSEVVVSGTTDPGTEVIVYVVDEDGNPVSVTGGGVADDNGKYAVVVDNSLSDGTYSVFVVSADGKNVEDVSTVKTLVVDSEKEIGLAVEGLEDLELKLSSVRAQDVTYMTMSAEYEGQDVDVVAHGTTTPNSDVNVEIVDENGSVIVVAEGESTDSGTFSIRVSDDIPDGDYNVNVTINERGKTALEASVEALLQVVRPEKARLNQVQGERGNLTITNPKPRIKGLSKPGSVIHAKWKSLQFTSVVVADTVTGEFEITPPKELEEGAHVAYVYPVDEEQRVTGKALEVSFNISDELHGSAAMQERDDRGFPYFWLLLVTMVAFGGAYVMLRKRNQIDEGELINKL